MVNQTGIVTILQPGVATITVKTIDGGYTAVCIVSVQTLVTSVKINPTTKTLAVGKNFQLAAWPQPSTAANKNVTWSSSDTAIAKVSSTGLVTGVKNGTATITVKTADGGKTATCQIKVGVSVRGVRLNTYSKTLGLDKTFQLVA